MMAKMISTTMAMPVMLCSDDSNDGMDITSYECSYVMIDDENDRPMKVTGN